MPVSRLDRIAIGCPGTLEKKMAVSEDHVRRVFRALENGHRGKFLDHVANNVDWIVEGAHSLVAHYRSKGELLAGSFADRIVPPGAQLVVEHVTMKDDEAVVELRSLATARDGGRFDTRYCWVVHFAGDIIDQVRAYLDSAMVARLSDENRNQIQPPRRSHNGKARGVRRGEGITSAQTRASKRRASRRRFR
jgi:ketosteroid isomerase-like protein